MAKVLMIIHCESKILHHFIVNRAWSERVVAKMKWCSLFWLTWYIQCSGLCSLMQP